MFLNYPLTKTLVTKICVCFFVNLGWPKPLLLGQKEPMRLFTDNARAHASLTIPSLYAVQSHVKMTVESSETSVKTLCFISWRLRMQILPFVLSLSTRQCPESIIKLFLLKRQCSSQTLKITHLIKGIIPEGQPVVLYHGFHD